MPDLTTHYLFGERVLEELSEDLKQMIETHRIVFNFAVQGPDLLFFRKVLTGAVTTMSNLPVTGSRMHHQKIGETMNFMKAYISVKQDSGTEYDILRTYFLGFICHYYLDKTVHPYVYFMVDSICARHPERTPRSMHARVESELDSILYYLFKKRPVTTFPVKEYFTLDTFSKNVIARMYTDLLEEVYSVETTVGEVMKSFDDMKKVSRMLYDNSGFMPAFRNVLGEAFPKTLDLTYQIKPKKVKADTANFSENTWHHPEHPEVKQRKSVLRLFNDAKEEVVPVLEKTYRQMDSGKPVCFDTSLDFGGREIQ